MKRQLLLALVLLAALVQTCFAQKENILKMKSEYGSDNKEMLDLFRFENIDYYKIKFSGEEIKTKTYVISVKEIWDGVVKKDTIVFDSKEMAKIGLDKVNDTALNMKVMSKLTAKNKLKITFMFPRFSATKEYDALDTDEYSLRNLADESKLPIGYGKKFYFMAYILPYQRANGSKSWCEVGSSGKDIENWGKKFGIKHYLLFEMKIE